MIQARISMPIAVLILGLLANPVLAVDQLPPGYSSSVRPDPEGVPTPVDVNILIVDIPAISDVAQTFTADIHFSMRWKDPRLADPQLTHDRKFPLEKIWNPQPGILNRRNLDIILPNLVRVDPQGNVLFTQRVYGDFAAPLDLRKFPVDKQVLLVEVVSYWYGPDELVFTSEENSKSHVKEFSLSGWHILSDFANVWEEHDAQSKLDVAHISWHIDIQRDRSHFRYNFFIPLVLILLMAWCVFWIDPNYLPSQIAVSTSSVFTLIAFRFSMALFLPRVSYMTIADKFTLGVTVLVFYALAQAISTGWLAKNNKEALAHAMDRWGRWVYLIIFAVILTITLGSAI